MQYAKVGEEIESTPDVPPLSRARPGSRRPPHVGTPTEASAPCSGCRRPERSALAGRPAAQALASHCPSSFLAVGGVEWRMGKVAAEMQS